MGYPRNWSLYVDTVKELGLPVDEKYSVWASRFRAAKALSGMSFDGLSQASSEGFFLATKITMIDTALEALEVASDRKIGSMLVRSMDAGYELWAERMGDVGLAMAKLTNRAILESWKEFTTLDAESVQTANLRFILRAFRHLNSHGLLTPNSAGVYRSPALRRRLLEIVDAALISMEEQFENYLSSGALQGDASTSNWLTELSAAAKVGTLYIGHVSRIGLLGNNEVFVQLDYRSHRILNLDDFSLSEIYTHDEPPRQLMGEQHPKDYRVWRELATKSGLDESSDFALWSIDTKLLLVGHREGFAIYDQESKAIKQTFLLPPGVLPGYLNGAQISFVGDRQGVILSLDNFGSYLHLDFIKGSTKKIEMKPKPSFRQGIYVDSIQGFLTLENTGHSIGVYSTRQITLPDLPKPAALLDASIPAGWAIDIFQGPGSDQLIVQRLKDFIVLDTKSGDLEEFFDLGGTLGCCIFDSNFEYFLTSDGDAGFRRINLETRVFDEITGLTNPRMHGLVNRTPKTLVSSDEPLLLFAIDPDTWEQVGASRFDFNEISSATWLSEDRIMVMGSRDGKALVKILSGNLKEKLSEFELDLGSAALPTLLAFEPETKTVLGWAGARSSIIRIDPEAGTVVGELASKSTAVGVSIEHQLIAVCPSEERVVSLYSTEDFSKISTFELPNSGQKILFSRDGGSLWVHCQESYLMRFTLS